MSNLLKNKLAGLISHWDSLTSGFDVSFSPMCSIYIMFDNEESSVCSLLDIFYLPSWQFSMFKVNTNEWLDIFPYMWVAKVHTRDAPKYSDHE